MTKHTPGPWKVIQSDSPVVQTEDDHHAICTTYGVYATREQKEANANLIAAAPEMLSALKGFVKAWSEGRFLMEGYEYLKACRDSIQKAEGCYQTVDCNVGDHADCCPAK